MSPGLTEDLQKIDDARKTAIIDSELARLNVDIACLQETRLADSGCIREANYTFYWQGLSADEPRRHGVGFAVKKYPFLCYRTTNWRIREDTLSSSLNSSRFC